MLLVRAIYIYIWKTDVIYLSLRDSYDWYLALMIDGLVNHIETINVED